MKKKYIFLPLLILLGCLFTGCDDYLDESPDKRTELDTDEKIKKILVSAYNESYSPMMLETMSDNADHNIGNWAASYGMEDAYYFKEDISFENEVSYFQWEGNYKAIAAANHALEAIKNFGDPERLNAVKAEALLCRAYAHFCLATMFCQPYGVNSDNHLGLPYMEVPEKSVGPKYQRGTLTELYEKINRDIEEALPLIDDGIYSVPKYHFNRNAAYAFAALFNLHYRNYDKTIGYANLVLGENPSSVLRDWYTWGLANPNDPTDSANQFNNVNSPANLLNISSISAWGLIAGTSSQGSKFFHNELIQKRETFEAPGPWGQTIMGTEERTYYFSIWSNSQAFPKTFIRKYAGYFQILDFSSMTGYYRNITPVFTTDELLLYRAEAYALKGGRENLEKAVQDMSIFMHSFSRVDAADITFDKVVEYYTNLDYSTADRATTKKRFHTDSGMPIEPTLQEPILHYILHIKRLAKIHDGSRYLDMNRYGITVYRRQIDQNNLVVQITDEIPITDLRRVLQLPAEVIGAGMQENPR